MLQLYIEGHHVQRGYIVSLELAAAAPVRFFQRHPAWVRAVVERFNRMQRYRACKSVRP